jgi:alpha-L-rhamnosidase
MKFIAALFFSCTLAQAHSTLDLKVGHQTSPSGVDDAKPRLSWRMEGGDQDLAQSAYQILVATCEENLAPSKADLWDSG